MDPSGFWRSGRDFCGMLVDGTGRNIKCISHIYKESEAGALYSMGNSCHGGGKRNGGAGVFPEPMGKTVKER